MLEGLHWTTAAFPALLTPFFLAAVLVLVGKLAIKQGTWPEVTVAAIIFLVILAATAIVLFSIARLRHEPKGFNPSYARVFSLERET